MDRDQARVETYRDLRVWQEAMSLAEACYRLTREFAKEEMFGMTSQIRRSAASIAANIAEGYGRDQTRPFIHFLRIAQGSLKELETHLLLAERVNLTASGASQPVLSACDTLSRMLRSLIRSLQRREVEVRAMIPFLFYSPLTTHYSRLSVEARDDRA